MRATPPLSDVWGSGAPVDDALVPLKMDNDVEEEEDLDMCTCVYTHFYVILFFVR